MKRELLTAFQRSRGLVVAVELAEVLFVGTDISPQARSWSGVVTWQLKKNPTWFLILISAGLSEKVGLLIHSLVLEPSQLLAESCGVILYILTTSLNAHVRMWINDLPMSLCICTKFASVLRCRAWPSCLPMHPLQTSTQQQQWHLSRQLLASRCNEAWKRN